jgi:hypothetical protein
LIKVSVNSEDWKLSTYTCSAFKKDYICMHLVCIRLKLCTAPTVGEHRGSGRPAKVPIKSAWLSQGDTFISQFKGASLPAIESKTTPTTTSTSTGIPRIQYPLPTLNFFFIFKVGSGY